MSAVIRDLASVEEARALRGLVLEYMEYELVQLHEVSELKLEAAPLVEATFADLAAYLPPRGHTCVAEQDGKLRGCAFLRMIRPDTAEIKRLYVRPGARGQRLGQRLTEQLLKAARDLGAVQVLLDTGVYDRAAQGLYRKLGFRRIDPYPEGESDPSIQPYLTFMQLDL